MTDIVEQLEDHLKERWAVLYEHDHWIREAADEIKRLREQLRLTNIDQCNAEARLASAMEALKYNNIHLNETWCWCEPTVESHTD